MVARRSHSPLEAMLDDIAGLARISASIEALDPAAPPTVTVVVPAVSAGARAGHVAIIAGSFNPLTLAHVALAGAALAAGADAVYLSLSRLIIDKGEVPRPSLADRAMILSTFARRHDRFGALLCNRGLYADQAVAVRAHFPKADRLTFVVGFDKAAQIFDRHYYTDPNAALGQFFCAAELMVAPRGSSDVQTLRALVNQEENRRFAHRVHALPLDPAYANESATRVRELARDGQPVAALVPEVTNAFLALANPYEAARTATDVATPDAYGARQERLRAYQQGSGKG